LGIEAKPSGLNFVSHAKRVNSMQRFGITQTRTRFGDNCREIRN
jgi:hypothetical protein